jgi:CspA family cold shock protein
MVQDWVDGVVREYDDREGFGVIDSLDTPGGCWFHYSMIEVPGRKTLFAGQLVRFTFESEVEQDGFVFRALQARPSI